MTKATLGGLPLLASSAVRWALKAGVRPFTTTVDMAPAHADALLANTLNVGKPTELVIASDAGAGLKTVTVKNVWVLGRAPGNSPKIATIMLADRRWMWSYPHVLGRYNIRRRAGVKRIKVNDQAANDVVADKFQYALWSLHDGSRKWYADEVLDDVIFKVESRLLDGPAKAFVDPALNAVIKALPVEDLEIDDTGDSAIARAVAYLQEADLFIDYDGNIQLYGKSSGKEAELAASLGPETVGHGHIATVDLRLIRPQYIDILFTREMEIRFDYSEADTTISENEDRRILRNVGPQPDYSLTISGRSYPAGTWHTLPEYYAAWGNMPNPFGGPAEPLSATLVERAMAPFMDLWACIGSVGQFDPDADWIARISMIQSHWRQTYQIQSRWMDRILSVRPYRVATVDQTTGARAPAMAWSDYFLLTGTRAQWKERAKGLTYGIDVDGLDSFGQNLDNTTRPAPAVVSVPDSDQGILHLDYIIDPLRLMEQVIPGKLDTGNVPRGDLTQRAHSISFDSVFEPSQPLAKMAGSFLMSCIVTCIPASPNGTQQLHRLRVFPGLIEDRLVPGGAGLGECLGPPMELRIGGGLETARVQWLDSKATEIERVFGLTPGDPKLDGLVVNEGSPGATGGGGGGASLWAIAEARAAAVYASLRNRKEGEMAGDLTPGALLAGWSDELAHVVTVQGEAFTELRLPERVPQFNLMAWLDGANRAILLRLVQR